MNNEETILQNENRMDDEQTLLQGENNHVAEAAAGTKKGGDAWKYAAGAIPGMVVGAGAVLAADAMASGNSTTTNPTIPATEGEKAEGENAEQLKPADYTEQGGESAANTTAEATAEADAAGEAQGEQSGESAANTTAEATAEAAAAQGEQGGADTEQATPEEIAYAEEHNGALPYEGEEAAAVVNTEAGNKAATATEAAAGGEKAAAASEAAADEAVKNVDVSVDGTDVKVVTADGVNVNIHINTDAAEGSQPANGEEIGSGVSAPSVADVSDDMSFSEAFAAARDQVGAGGVFHWRGGIYGTYYADEWSKISAAEKNLFVDEARMEMKPGEGDPSHYLANHTSDENYGDDELQADNDDADIAADIHETSFLAGDDDIGSGVSAPSVADVSDDMSFSEAFAAARDQVGAGGVFHWRGGIYGTYYADEWSKISAAEKNLFVDEARMEMKPGEGDPSHYLANHTSDENYGDDELQADNDDADIAADIHETSFLAGDDDIRIIGLDTIDVGNGQEITMGTMNVGGTDVSLVDADGDGTFDIMAADVNGNGEVDPGEIVGIDDADASVENFLSLSDGDSILADIELDGGSDIPADELYDL